MPGQESVTFTVDVFRDNSVEEAEFFDMFIPDDSVVGAVLNMAFVTQVRIMDNDCKCTVNTFFFICSISLLIPVLPYTNTRICRFETYTYSNLSLIIMP